MRHARHIAVAAALLIGVIEARGANSPSALDLPPSNVLPAPVEIAPGAPVPPQQPVELPPTEPNGNPLWAIPLSSLTATRDRPLFLPSRRAPAAAVAGPVAVAPAAPPPPPPAEQERPALTLIGVIAGESEGFAVFLDQASNSVVRLKTGQDHSGWVLRAVKGREATLHKNGKSEILALPVPGGGGVIPGGEPSSGPPPGGAGGVPDYLRPGGRGLPAAVPLPGGGLRVPRPPEPEL
jgi:general secretion pathway protein N